MRINTSNFINDLEEGHKWEKVILADIQKKYPKAYLNDDNRYDIKVPETGDSIEVKFDKLSSTTDNYFIEVAFDDKPSGIAVTEATYWVIVDNDYKIWMRVEALRHMIEDLDIKDCEGEGHIISGVLIKRDRVRMSPYVKIYKLL